VSTLQERQAEEPLTMPDSERQGTRAPSRIADEVEPIEPVSVGITQDPSNAA
jgi:hypothetical protein